MSHWGGDSDNTFSDSDFESDREYICSDTEPIESDTEIIEYDWDASSGEETQGIQRQTTQDNIWYPTAAFRRTSSCLPGLQSTELCDRGMEVQGLHDTCGSGYVDRTILPNERPAVRQRCQQPSGTENNVEKS